MKRFGLSVLTVGLGMGLFFALPDPAAAQSKVPPGGSYGQVSALIALPDFLPGLGTLYVDPAKLPAGPFLAYDRQGHLLSSIYMIPLKDIVRAGSASEFGHPAASWFVHYLTMKSMWRHWQVPDAALDGAHRITEPASNRAGSSVGSVRFGAPGWRVRVTVIAVAAGGELAPHRAAGPIRVPVLEGEVSIDAGAHAYVLSPGDILVLAPGVEHSVRSEAGGVLLQTVVRPTRPAPGSQTAA